MNMENDHSNGDELIEDAEDQDGSMVSSYEAIIIINRNKDR